MKLTNTLIIGMGLSLGLGANAHNSHTPTSTEAYEVMGYQIGSESSQEGSANPNSEKYSFQIVSDLIQPEKKDSYGNTWHRGFLTDKNVVKVGFSSNDPRVASVEVALVHGNVAFRTKEGATIWVDDAIKGKYEGLDVKKIGEGETVSFDISAPGRNVIGWVVRDANDSILYDSKFLETHFDALFDDGKWTPCGEVELTSNYLKKAAVNHEVKTIKYNWINNLGPLWYSYSDENCGAEYPYYHGESWVAKLDYHPDLKRYRIVNPLTSNEQFKDYTVKKEETLAYVKNGAAEYPAAFLFDTENPSWLIINAEDPEDVYHEISSIGMMMLHNMEERDFFARKYNELEGCEYFIFESEMPKQRIADGVYFEDPDVKEYSLISIRFDPKVFDRSEDSGIVNITDDADAEEVFYTLDGYRVENPSAGIFLKRKGSKVSKVIL
ncbi:MAG: hypothetical protein K2M59_07660 [Muribaculaceae bacterium]|nr:hypothetical protein [Muribaculaceae bacterium]